MINLNFLFLLKVTQLLAGGIIETQFGELMMSARNETPTPPVEDDGNSMILLT